MVVSLTTQCCIALVLILLPLLHPESLPGRVKEFTVSIPTPVQQPPKTVAQRVSASISSIAPALGRILIAPRITPSRIDTTVAPDTTASFTGMDAAMPMGTLLGATDRGTTIIVAEPPAPKSVPVRVSAGVSAGLLLTPIRPIYPAIAKLTRVAGAVVVEAVISKTGTIESLHVLSGPAMLRAAATDAIRAARYQPFQLNGVPTEVQTTITVNFHMES
jgi:protein TonB